MTCKPTLLEFLEYRRRMLLSEIQWIEDALDIEPKTSKLRKSWRRGKIAIEVTPEEFLEITKQGEDNKKR